MSTASALPALYYAVRVGRHRPLSSPAGGVRVPSLPPLPPPAEEDEGDVYVGEDEDDEEDEGEGVTIDDDGGIHPSKPASEVLFRSAIFFRWEDAAKFVEHTDEDGDVKISDESVCSAFRTLEEAAAYLAGDEESEGREEEECDDASLVEGEEDDSLAAVTRARRVMNGRDYDNDDDSDYENSDDDEGDDDVVSTTISREAGGLGSAWEAYQLEVAEAEGGSDAAATARDSDGDGYASGSNLKGFDDPSPIRGAPASNNKEGRAGATRTTWGGRRERNSGRDRKSSYWETMYRKLVKYKNANNGSIDIPDVSEGGGGDNNDPETKKIKALRRWCRSQIKQQRLLSHGHGSSSLTAERIEKLREVGMRVIPPYDEMYEKLAAHKAETWTLDVDREEDEELFLWTREQRNMLVRHFQGNPIPLPGDRIEDLVSLGFERYRSSQANNFGVVDSGSEDRKFDAMVEGLLKYKRDHGGYTFGADKSSLTREERLVMYFVIRQRKEYKKLQRGEESTLTARRLQRLTATGLELAPVPMHVPWEERMRDLRAFAAEHGHCRVPGDHPTLGNFANLHRRNYRKREKGEKTPLTDERVNELLDIGFVFKLGKSLNRDNTSRNKTWDERFEELLAFKEENGHMFVPQEGGGTLGRFVQRQRAEYKKLRAGQKTAMTAERALKLTEIGFCFDASFRFRGHETRKRKERDE